VIASVMDIAGKSAGFMSGRDNPYEAARGWLDNPFAYDQALQAAVRVLDQLRPSGEIEAPDGRPPAGQPKATGYIDHQGRPMTEDEFYQRGRAYLQRLGTSTADQLLDQARGTRPKQAEKMRADLGRLAGRLDQEDDK
jgi:hypothetical protein